MLKLTLLLLLLLPLLALTRSTTTTTTTTAHPDHNSDPPKTWAELHLEQEHHIDNFDPGAFFTLHDFDSSGTWTRAEVLRFYGLSQSDGTFSEETKSHVWRTILASMDSDHNDEISMEEFLSFSNGGNTLPDFGLGPGHHGDDEYEYEIHHFEKYHDEDTTEDELTHPEDIEHFRKHDQEHRAEERQVVLDMKPIIEQNIPRKFLVEEGV